MAAPLRLKAQKVGKPEPNSKRPVLSVLVDTGVYHLDGEYEYLLPKGLEVDTGDWVSISFKGKNTVGLVVSRGESSKIQNALFINKPIKGPKISAEFLFLYREIARKWVTNIFDVLRFVARNKVQRLHTDMNSPIGNKFSQDVAKNLPKRNYYQLNPNNDEISQVRTLAKKLAKEGPTLVIVPEARTLDLLISEHFQVAMRSGILTPYKFTNVLVLREDSEHHYELKSPGFNTRDVALMRSEMLGENLLFVGFSPSLEMQKAIQEEKVTLKRATGRTRIIALPSLQGELIPSRLLPEFKTALQNGPILVLVPSKGYGRSISCAKCRNIAKCECGARLTKRSRHSDLICSLCSKNHPDWRCAFCGNEQIALIGKGIERIAEELGRSFPGTKIHISTADKFMDQPLGKRTILLSTIGAVPLQLFSATLFIDGLDTGTDLRSEERNLATYFRYTAASSGRAFIVDRPEAPIVSALIKWNPFNVLSKMIEELSTTKLPPSFEHILIKSETSESARIYSGLLSSVRDGRIPRNVSVINRGEGLISLFFSPKDAEKILDFMQEFQRKRSISGKRLLKMRVNPYLLG